MKTKKRILTAILFGLEAFILIGLAAAFVHAGKHSKEFAIPLDSFHSDYTDYENGSWSIPEGILPEGNQVIFLSGPYIELPAGHYRVGINYRAGSDQSFGPYAVNDVDEKSAYLKSGIALLGKNQTYVSTRFRTTGDLDNFEVRVLYDGKGALSIEGITVSSDPSFLSAWFIGLFLLFLILDLILLSFDFLKAHKRTVLILCGIGLLSCLPLFMPGFHLGHDTTYHLLRIDGIAEELRNRQFPVRIHSLWIDGYGFPVSVYYGDLLLYFPALLRLFGFPLMTAYKAYVCFVNLSTVLISWLCFRKMKLSENAAFMMTLAYVTAAYRLCNVYVRSALGEITAMMFIPLVVLSIWLIYADAEESLCRKRNSLLLALGMSGLVTCHALSTEMTVVTLSLVCIILWKKTFRLNTLRTFALAVLQTLLYTAYFWIPFLDYYRNVDARINVHDRILTIQTAGAYPAQFFSFFQDVFGSGNVSTMQVSWRLVMTPGPLLMGTLLLSLLLILKGCKDRIICFLSLLSLFFLFVATDLFPWNFLAMHTSVGNFLSQVEFPWRYIGMAGILLTVLTGYLFEKLPELSLSGNAKRMLPLTAVVLGIGYSIFFLSSYCGGAELADYYDTAELDRYMISTGEYCRNGCHTHILDNQLSVEGDVEANLTGRKGMSLYLHADTGNEGGIVTLPLFHYKGFHVTDDQGNEYQIFDGNNCQIAFELPDHFSGELSAFFREPFSWRIAELVSLLSWIALIILLLKAGFSSARPASSGAEK